MYNFVDFFTLMLLCVQRYKSEYFNTIKNRGNLFDLQTWKLFCT